MLYQKLLMGEKPYHIAINRLNGFEAHRHPDIEFLFCLKGSCNIVVDKRPLHLTEGCLAAVGSMIPHETLKSDNNRTLVIEVGPVLLGEYFEPLAKLNFPSPLLHLEAHEELHALFLETAGIIESNLPFSELSIRGSILKICACILQKLMESGPSAASRNLISIANIEKALEMIDNRFHEPLSVEDAASMCGYGKSNFCRIFKNITGDTFHNLLNRRRIQAAQVLLKETDAAMESIALQTGFIDAKSLCRAFRRSEDMTPGTFRAKFREASKTS